MRSGARSHPDRQFSMKRLILPLCLVAVLLAGCGSKSNADQGPFPDGFLTQSDSERVAYVMANATPDSTARFIINAALGKVKGARIDIGNLFVAVRVFGALRAVRKRNFHYHKVAIKRFDLSFYMARHDGLARAACVVHKLLHRIQLLLKVRCYDQNICFYS